MHLEEFAKGASLWHRTDPRVKIVTTALFAVITATSRGLPTLAAALALGWGYLLMAHLPARQVASRLLAVNGFVAFLWLFLPFTTPGAPLAAWGPLTVTRAGVWEATAITLKANAVMAAVIALLGTSTVFALVHALTHLYVPAKLVHLFFFCYRYISTIHEEYEKLRASMRIRSFRARTDLHTYRSLANLVGMLFVRSFERSQRIYNAMVLRGFTGTFWTLHHFHMRRRDWITSAWLTLAVAGLWWLEYGENLL